MSDDERLIRALANPIRRRALAILVEGPASPKEIAQQLGTPIPTVSYHVNVLRDLGMLELVSSTQRRGAIEHHYQAHVGAASQGWHLVAGVLGMAATDQRSTKIKAREVVVDREGQSAVVAATDRY